MLLVVASSLLGELLRRRSDGGDEESKGGEPPFAGAGAAMDMCVECITAVIAAEPGSTVHRLAVAYLGPLVAYSPVALSRPFVQARGGERVGRSRGRAATAAAPPSPPPPPPRPRQAACDMPIDARCRLLGMTPAGVAAAPAVDVLPVVGSLGMALELQPVTVRLPALPVVQVRPRGRRGGEGGCLGPRISGGGASALDARRACAGNMYPCTPRAAPPPWQALATLVSKRGLQQLDAGHFQVLLAGLRDAGWEAGSDRPAAPALATADGAASSAGDGGGDAGGKDLDDARLTAAFAEPYRALQVCCRRRGASLPLPATAGPHLPLARRTTSSSACASPTAARSPSSRSSTSCCACRGATPCLRRRPCRARCCCCTNRPRARCTGRRCRPWPRSSDESACPETCIAEQRSTFLPRLRSATRSSTRIAPCALQPTRWGEPSDLYEPTVSAHGGIWARV